MRFTCLSQEFITKTGKKRSEVTVEKAVQSGGGRIDWKNTKRKQPK